MLRVSELHVAYGTHAVLTGVDLAVPFGKVLDIPPATLRELPPEAMFDGLRNVEKLAR